MYLAQGWGTVESIKEESTHMMIEVKKSEGIPVRGALRSPCAPSSQVYRYNSQIQVYNARWKSPWAGDMRISDAQGYNYTTDLKHIAPIPDWHIEQTYSTKPVLLDSTTSTYTIPLPPPPIHVPDALRSSTDLGMIKACFLFFVIKHIQRNYYLFFQEIRNYLGETHWPNFLRTAEFKLHSS